MPGPDYMPASDASRIVWFNNFANKFGQFAAPLGFLPAELTAVNADAVMLSNAVNRNEATKQFARNVAQYKKAMIDGKIGAPTPTIPAAPAVAAPGTLSPGSIIARTRLLVNRIKAAPLYTENMGRDLGIIAVGENDEDNDTAQPTLTVAVTGGKVEIKFVKREFDGIILECKRGAEADFTVLQTVNVSPFVDPRPKVSASGSEVRSYRALFYKKNAGVGQYSAVATVVIP